MLGNHMCKENAKMIHGMVRAFCLASIFLHVSPSVSAPSHETALQIPANMMTHADGRAPIQQLYASYAQLIEQGWILEIVYQSEPFGTSEALPIIALRSPNSGPAAWFLAGIHGEEPAGPNAIAASIDELAELGRKNAVVLLPLCNPHGYARNWRYLNVPVYSESIEGNSVGDSSHLLPDPETP